MNFNFSKKPGASKPQPSKRRKAVFGNDDGSDDDTAAGDAVVQAITELDDFSTSNGDESRRNTKLKNRPPSQPPTSKAKAPESVMFGDLSSSLTPRKNGQAAEQQDSNIYDYDGVYESFKTQKKKATLEDVEQKPKYMSNLMAAAAVRKRDALVAEEKKLAREREAEGEEFADTEKFVTGAYRKQQEENRRLEEEERRREEEEAKKNGAGGMTAFYKNLLNKGEERHAEIMKAAEAQAKAGPKEGNPEEEKERTDADLAREINAKGGSILINEDGEVVDKRQLLKGGLNLKPKKKPEAPKAEDRGLDTRGGTRPGSGFVGVGGKQGWKDRQARMLKEQFEQTNKRSREEEEEEQKKLELASKSRKTEADMSSAKERYLARKRAAEEAKRSGIEE
jgi:coiled-coil domain-containing protein 55